MNEALHILKQTLARTEADIKKTREILSQLQLETENREFDLGDLLCREEDLIESIRILEQAFGGEDVSTSED